MDIFEVPTCRHEPCQSYFGDITLSLPGSGGQYIIGPRRGSRFGGFIISSFIISFIVKKPKKKKKGIMIMNYSTIEDNTPRRRGSWTYDMEAPQGYE